MKKKDVLTTGQVAQICNVAPRTVTKWFDSGQLKGYRIPGSKDRRIPTSELIRFMKAHDMPTDGLELGSLRVLLIDADWKQSDILSEALAQKKGYEVHTAQTSFDAGLMAQKTQPHAILINLMSNEIKVDHVCKNVRANEDLSATKLVAIAKGLSPSEMRALQQKGFDQVVTEPNDIDQVIRVIEEVTAIIY